MRRASAMPCKVTIPVNPNGSTWWRPYASDWSKVETKRLNSSCSKQDHEDIADRGQVSMSHSNMVHKTVSMSKTMEIPATNVAMDKYSRNWRMHQFSLCCIVIDTTIFLVGRTLPQQVHSPYIRFGFFLPSKR